MAKCPSEKFWSKVMKTSNPDECWIWQRAPNRPGGYGRFYLNGAAPVPAHRYAWESENGPIPPGLEVMHRCDNPLCCNPNHLGIGNHWDNMGDMSRKGRHSFCSITTRTRKGSGAGIPKRKVCQALRQEIRMACRDGGMVATEAAALYGIGIRTVYRIAGSLTG